jgi:hypothetical protein
MNYHRAKTLKKAFSQVDAETAKNFGVDIKIFQNQNTKNSKKTFIKTQKTANGNQYSI